VSDKPTQKETDVTQLSTVDSGKPRDSVDGSSPSVPDSGKDIAQSALAGAQRISRATLVGPEIAGRCKPVSLRDGELRLAAESTAWATQLRLLSGTVLAKLVAHLGPDVVTKLHISGPTGPSWKHGAWSVRGRGPRDTYG
jgi:hypothetical protein